MQIAIIGGGPAGLRAAEVAAAGGATVTVYDAKPSVGRKFLVAGRGGLNLTHAEPRAEFIARYRGGPWADLLAEWDADATRAWAAKLGIETFVASSGRVYPREMKAAPLLRRWVWRLREAGVQFAMHHRLVGLESGPRAVFATPEGTHTITPDALVLALGGGSWPETGSDGTWGKTLAALGVESAPLQPANCGWEVTWPASVLAAAEGQPLKNIVARADGKEAAGELLITAYGLEGGAIYSLTPALRAMAAPALSIDFKPALTTEELIAKLGTPRLRPLLEAQRCWKLSDAQVALIEARGAPSEPAALAALVKDFPVRLRGPRPLAEAISTAGGVRWGELDDALMLRRVPGIFLAGEMIDWEAPTGGYLLQGCFATATRAAHGALNWLSSRR